MVAFDIIDNNYQIRSTTEFIQKIWIWFDTKASNTSWNAMTWQHSHDQIKDGNSVVLYRN